jgi:Ca-activated chloride channel family protein
MTDLWNNGHFIRPWALLLAPLALGIWWWWVRQNDPLRGWRSQIEPKLLSELVIYPHATRHAHSFVILVAWFLTAVAIAGPTWRQEPNPFASDAEPLLILLKADASMNIAAAGPTPLEQARVKIAELAVARKGLPLGLIAYAGSAYLVIPPTKDTSVVMQMAARISPGIMPNAGDRLDLAFGQAAELLHSGEHSGSLLIIADSVNTGTNQLSATGSKYQPLPVQLLALSPTESSGGKSLQQAAQELSATVQPLTADDEDIRQIIKIAERHSTAGIAGKTSAWQEFGYWLTPAIACLAALSFRRKVIAGGAA